MSGFRISLPYRSLFVMIVIFGSVFVIGAKSKYTDHVPARGEILPNYSLASFKQKYDSTPAQRIEGIWQYVDDALVVGIEQFSHPDFSSKIRYRIILLESDDPALLPGAVVGYLAPNAIADEFDVYLYTAFDAEGNTSHPINCHAQYKDGKSLYFKKTKPINVRLRMNMSRLLPSFLKAISISVSPETSDKVKGFSRLYPDDNAGFDGMRDAQHILYL